MGPAIRAAAKQKGDDWLADRVYSGVPSDLFGLRQRIEISHVSGMSNVRYWLEEHGYDGGDEALCRHVFELAKRTDRVLRDEEIHAHCREYGAKADPAAASAGGDGPRA
jgi:isopropylmalate/homocitrate/citramalate synthase